MKKSSDIKISDTTSMSGITDITNNAVRKSFLDFFAKKDHHFVSSAPLIPQGDSTLLFINSGMAQFKEIFLGEKEAKFKRVCNSQKCIRLSGKHNDLEEVGLDTYHHTFFEMLGSWSFGDYYKKEAIEYAWELLTEVWALPKNLLYATVHKDDQEAYRLWQTQTDLDHQHIMYFGDKDNFWEMADVGPCGPCSEIHIDIGEENCTCKSEEKKIACKKTGGGVNADCGRYIEIWNLVFIQYYRDSHGKLHPLKDKFVDTGMGFERVTAVLQKKSSNYDTDIFMPYISALEKKTGISYREQEQNGNEQSVKAVAFRVIADHIRSITFSIADGVVPSNEGRGYVIRRLIRRAFRFGRELGLKEPFLHTMVSLVCKQMGQHFTEVNEKRAQVEKTLLEEEKLFSKTLERGLSRLHAIVEEKSQKGQKIISGKEAFELYDTYGFPLDLTILIAREKNFTVDEKVFDQEMAQQKNRSRQDLSNKNDVPLGEMAQLVHPKTKYCGDELRELHTGKIIALFQNGQSVEQISPNEKGYVCFDETIFYAEGGGQVGDTGKLLDGETTAACVTDTLKQNGVYFLKVEAKKTLEKKTYGQIYDFKRREAIRKNHSAAHLLLQALVDTLGEHVHQAGSFINEEKLRFDFNHNASLNEENKNRIQSAVREKIAENLQTTIKTMKKEEALAMGARAFFEEKYGDMVRVVSLGEYSTELCGGSHVKRSSEIGGFVITSEGSVASGIRRVEAVTGDTLNQLYLEKQFLLQNAMRTLQVAQENELAKKIQSLIEENKKLSQKIDAINSQEAKKELAKSQEDLQSILLFKKSFKNISPKLMRKIIDEQLQSNSFKKPAVFIISTVFEEKANIFLTYTPEKSELLSHFDTNTIIKKAGEMIGGSGGGKSNFCQAGGKEINRLNETLNMIEKSLREMLKKASP